MVLCDLPIRKLHVEVNKKWRSAFFINIAPFYFSAPPVRSSTQLPSMTDFANAADVDTAPPPTVWDPFFFTGESMGVNRTVGRRQIFNTPVIASLVSAGVLLIILVVTICFPGVVFCCCPGLRPGCLGDGLAKRWECRLSGAQSNLSSSAYKEECPWPAMQSHAYKWFLAFLSGNLAPLLLRLQYILNVFKFLSFVKSLSMPIDSLLTTIFFLETKSLPSKPTKSYESEPVLPEPKMPLPNAGPSNRHCLSIEKMPNRQRRGNLTMSSRLAGWSPRLC